MGYKDRSFGESGKVICFRTYECNHFSCRLIRKRKPGALSLYGCNEQAAAVEVHVARQEQGHEA